MLIPDHPYLNQLVRLTAPQTLFGGTWRAGSIWRCFQVMTTTDSVLRCNLKSLDGSERVISHCRVEHVELVEPEGQCRLHSNDGTCDCGSLWFCRYIDARTIDGDDEDQQGATHDDGDLFAELTELAKPLSPIVTEEIEPLF